MYSAEYVMVTAEQYVHVNTTRTNKQTKNGSNKKRYFLHQNKRFQQTFFFLSLSKLLFSQEKEREREDIEPQNVIF